MSFPHDDLPDWSSQRPRVVLWIVALVALLALICWIVWKWAALMDAPH